MKPFIIKSPENRSVESGDDARLSCIAGGRPTPDVRWIKVDGKITLDEMKAWGAAKSKPVPAEKIETIFKKRDKNGDGALTADEVKGGKKKPKAGGEGKKKKPGPKDGAAG